MLRKHVSLAGLLGALVLLGAGCGGPMEEGDLGERGSQAEALTARVVDPTAPIQAPAQDGSSAQTVSAFSAAANLPNVQAVSDSQDPIPITNDGRPVTGGGAGGNPDPGDPNAYRGATTRTAIRR